MSASTASKTPVPFRITFSRGDAAVYVNTMTGDRIDAKIRRVVNVAGMTKRIRYYSLDIAPGVLIPADRLLHPWEG